MQRAGWKPGDGGLAYVFDDAGGGALENFRMLEDIAHGVEKLGVIPGIGNSAVDHRLADDVFGVGDKAGFVHFIHMMPGADRQGNRQCANIAHLNIGGGGFSMPAS